MNPQEIEKWKEGEVDKIALQGQMSKTKRNTASYSMRSNAANQMADAAFNLLSKEISELKLQLSERNDRLEGVDKRNYELLEYVDSLKKEISEKDEEIKELRNHVKVAVEKGKQEIERLKYEVEYWKAKHDLTANNLIKELEGYRNQNPGIN